MKNKGIVYLIIVLLVGVSVFIWINNLNNSYVPVCGVDNITYDNKKMAKEANVEIAHEGVCEELLGGDKDEHGCIGSAGYTWCESKQKCIRPWEEDCPEVSGIANPASVYCSEKGGETVIKKLPDGSEYGVCVFDDNRQCEEWALFNEDCPIGGRKVTGYETEAQIYCAIRGGEVDMDKDTCTLKNGKVVDTEDYYNHVESKVEEPKSEKIVVFENGYGQMCLDLKEYLEVKDYAYTDYLTSDVDFYNKLEEYKKNFKKSEGVSSRFEYYPIIFIGDKAFSGFNNEMKVKIEEVLNN